MATIAFWLVWITVTAYLYQQWQRYEPTRVVIDAAAAVAALPLALVIAGALV